jgi:hypothetical protein
MKVQFLFFLFYLFASSSQLLAESEKWLIVPFEKINHDAKCEKLSKQFLQTLTQSLSSELSIVMIADLQALPCSKEDCAKVRAQNLSSYFVIYGKSICEKTSLEIHTNLGFFQKGAAINDTPQWVQKEYVVKQNQDQDFQVKAYEVLRKMIDQTENLGSSSSSANQSLNEFSFAFSYVATSLNLDLPMLYGFSIGYARQLNFFDKYLTTLGVSAQKIGSFKTDTHSDLFEQTNIGLDFKFYSSKKSAVRYFIGVGLMRHTTTIKKIDQKFDGNNQSDDFLVGWRYEKKSLINDQKNGLLIPISIGVRWFSTLLQPTFHLSYQKTDLSSNYTLNLGGVW